MRSSNLFTLVVSTFLVCTGGFAQTPEKAKTGDRLGVETLRYDTRGREVYIASSTKAMIELQVTATERVFKWDSGLIQKYDQNYTQFERSSRGTTTPTEPRSQLKYLNLDGDPKARKEVSNSYLSNLPQCGNVVATYVSEGKDIAYPITLRGKLTETKAIEVLLDGKWTAGCGTGKQTVKVTYSPELDLLLGYEFMNFQPTGILNAGSGWRVISLE